MQEDDTLDYPDPTPPAIASAQDGSPDLTPVRRLVIPALDLDAPVRYIPFNGKTWRVDTLESQIAWLGDTGWPGLGGNIGLAGHVSLNDGSDGPFRNLSRLKPGDIVKVYTSQKIYTFRVNDLSTVAGGDISVVAQTDVSQLTLITCADWDKQSQTYLSRLVVSSDLVDVQPASQANSN
jgi:sortase A